MIYFSSYNNKLNHHGDLVSISLRQPFPTPTTLDFFKPTQAMLTAWKKGKQTQKDWKEYCENYWKLLKQTKRERLVHEWLNSLTSSDEMTLLCYEKDDTFCHRQLVAQVVQKYRPEIYGGRDLPLLQIGDRVQHRSMDKGLGTISLIQDKHHHSVFVVWDSEPVGSIIELKHPYKDQSSTRVSEPRVFQAKSLILADKEQDQLEF